jgi:hypothetical protein
MRVAALRLTPLTSDHGFFTAMNTRAPVRDSVVAICIQLHF